MSFQDLIRKRYSVRAYKSDPVPDGALDLVLEAARLAPTADNRQAFRLIVVPTRDREQDLRRVYDKAWFVQAPLVICVCSEPARGWVRKQDGRNYVDVDAAIVMDHLILAATELDLGTCWIAAFDPAAAREVLEVPEGLEPVLLTPLGYPDDRPRERKRRELDDLVLWRE